jgi:hypothetical protein
MARPVRTYVRVLAVATCVTIAMLITIGMTAIASPIGGAARVCSAPSYPGSGYFTSLTVSRVGCATGRRLAVAYYRCRTRSGPAGRCHRRVLGFTCHEQRNRIATEIDARVRCRRNGQSVVHTYQQNL